MRNASSSLTVKTPYRMESQVSHQCFITVDDFFLECSWDEMSCWSKELHLVTHCRKTSCTDHVLHQTWPWSITSLVLYSCLLLGFSPSKCIHHPFTFPPNYLAIKLKCHDTSIHSIPVWPLPPLSDPLLSYKGQMQTGETSSYWRDEKQKVGVWVSTFLPGAVVLSHG